MLGREVPMLGRDVPMLGRAPMLVRPPPPAPPPMVDLPAAELVEMLNREDGCLDDARDERPDDVVPMDPRELSDELDTAASVVLLRAAMVVLMRARGCRYYGNLLCCWKSGSRLQFSNFQSNESFAIRVSYKPGATSTVAMAKQLLRYLCSSTEPGSLPSTAGERTLALLCVLSPVCYPHVRPKLPLVIF